MNIYTPASTAEDELVEAYHEWRRWSQLVGQAIEDNAWDQVAVGQQRILALREKISQLSPPVRLRWAAAGRPGAIKESILNGLIRDLMTQAGRNQTRLAEKKEAVRLKLGGTGVVTHNLKRLRSSYVINRPGRRTALA